MAKTLIRVVDDDDAMREAVVFLLESEGYKVAEYPDAESFLRDDAPSVPGCIILDLRMPGMSGAELQETMLERGYHIPIIFLSGHGSIDVAVRSVRLGAIDFLQKPLDNARFLQAVKKAVSLGQKGYRPSELEPFEAKKRWDSLTDREKQIAMHISNGLLNKDIAERLGISARTVEHHREKALLKLGVKTQAELNNLLCFLEST